MRHTGKIAAWKDDKGFGFIRPDDGTTEIFVHRHDFKNRSRTPVAGEAVSYRISLDAQTRLKAVSVRFHDEDIVSFSVHLENSLMFCFIMMYLLGLAVSIHAYRLPWYVPLAIFMLSIVSYVTYRADKRASERGHRRVPESTLHFLSLLGGWPGAWIAQVLLRHKSSKQSFRIVFYTIVFVNIAFLSYEAMH